MKAIISSFAVFVCSLTGSAQQTILSAGSSQTLFIKAGTILGADSLVLTPSSNFTFSSNTLTVSPTAVNLAPAPSINRVYSLTSQINFTGTIQLYYQPSELNGNPESALQYTDSAVGGSWLASPSSTVNTSLHYVQQTASARNIIGATASHQGTILALSLISFTGAWQGSDVGLSWTIDQTAESGDYTVERSADGSSWTDIGFVAGNSGDGLRVYQYTDAGVPAGTLLYRLVISRTSGRKDYSNIVRLQHGSDGQLRLVAASQTVTAWFDGVLPSSVRIVNAVGAVLRVDMTSRPKYEFSGLPAGVYFMQYEINGSPGVRSFLIN
jgi:hypothetical protein